MGNLNNAKTHRYRECVSFLEGLKAERLEKFKESDLPSFVVAEFIDSVDSVLSELQKLLSGNCTVSTVKVEPLNINFTEQVKKTMIKKKIVSRECFASPEQHPDDWILINGVHKMLDNLLLMIVKSKRGADWTIKQLENVDQPKWIKDTKTFLLNAKGQRGKVGAALVFLFNRHRYLFRGKGDHEFMNLAKVGVAEWSKAPPNIRRLYKQVKNMNSNLIRKRENIDVTDL